MFRWGFLFWLDWLLLVVWLCVKKIFSCIGKMILTVMIFAGIVIGVITYLTGMDIAELFMTIWNLVEKIIELIDWLKKVLSQ